MIILPERKPWYERPLTQDELDDAEKVLKSMGKKSITKAEIRAHADKTRWSIALRAWLKSVASCGPEYRDPVRRSVIRARQQGMFI